MGSVSGFLCSVTTEEGEEQNWVLPLLPAVLLFIKDGILPAPPTAPLLHWIISSLPPQRQFANHNLVVIILDDELWQLWLP